MRGDRSRIRRFAPIGGLLVLAIAVYAIDRELRTLSYDSLIGALGRYSTGVLALAILLTAASYVVMTGYDTLAFRYVDQAKPYRRIAPRRSSVTRSATTRA